MTWSRRAAIPIEEQFAWWNAALADPLTERHDGDPQPGYYAVKAGKGKPWSAVFIWMEQDLDEAMELISPVRILARQGNKNVDAYKIWTYCRPVTKERFDRIEAFRSTHMHDDRETIDLSRKPTKPW